MTDAFTSLLLALLTLLAIAAWAMALRRLRHPDEPSHAPGSHAVGSHAPGSRAPGSHAVAGRAQQAIVAGIGAVCAGLFVYRWLALHGVWQPLEAHVDGLLLIAALFAAIIAFLQSRPRLFGIAAFGLPLLAVILAWAVCAATWTYRPFNIDTLHPVWRGLHLGGVYLGTICAAVAAIAGGMYLYVQRRLKRKQNLKQLGRLASLEALETLIIRTATLGFALLTLGLVTGLVVLFDDAGVRGNLVGYAPKLVLATLAWLSFAVVMNVRFAATFRGRRAAWLAIVGLVLLLAVYSLVNVWGARSGPVARSSSAQAEVHPCAS